MFIEWSESHDVGIPAIDSDHRKLVDLVNHFFARSQAEAAAPELRAILDSLVDEVAGHFRREELLLERADIPDLASHLAEHQRLLQQIRHFQESYEAAAEPRQLTMEMAEFLSHWLLDHIVEQDRPAGPHLRRLT